MTKRLTFEEANQLAAKFNAFVVDESDSNISAMVCLAMRLPDRMQVEGYAGLRNPEYAMTMLRTLARTIKFYFAEPELGKTLDEVDKLIDSYITDRFAPPVSAFKEIAYKKIASKLELVALHRLLSEWHRKRAEQEPGRRIHVFMADRLLHEAEELANNKLLTDADVAAASGEFQGK